jgi:hypothetical protein
MARVTYVKKSQKDQGNCAGCGTPIPKGSPYKWFANRIGRFSSRKNYCANCRIRPSMMTTSPHLSALYAAQENAEDALGASGELTLADFAQIVRDYGEAVREVGEGYEESAQNMEDGFGHETYQSEELHEKARACEDAADQADTAADEIESMEDPDEDESEFLGDYDGETNDDGSPVDSDEWEEFVQNKRDERREAANDAAIDAVSEGVSF